MQQAKSVPIQLPLFPERASLSRIRPEINEWRYYPAGGLARPVRPRAAGASLGPDRDTGSESGLIPMPTRALPSTHWLELFA